MMYYNEVTAHIFDIKRGKRVLKGIFTGYAFTFNDEVVNAENITFQYKDFRSHKPFKLGVEQVMTNLVVTKKIKLNGNG